MRGCRLSLRLLGGFELHRPDGEPVAVPGRRERVLLSYLALDTEQRRTRRALAEFLWGDAADDTTLDNLRTCLWSLRRALGEDADSVIAADRETIALAPAAVEVDASVFLSLARSRDTGDLEQAAALYAGEVLEGIDIPSTVFGDWLHVERMRCRDAVVGVLGRLVAARSGHDDAEGAIEAGQRLLAIEPLHEETVRALMPLYGALGRRQAIRDAYETLANRLKAELDVEPEPETRDAFEDALKRVVSEAPGADYPLAPPHGPREPTETFPVTPPARTRWRLWTAVAGALATIAMIAGIGVALQQPFSQSDSAGPIQSAGKDRATGGTDTDPDTGYTRAHALKRKLSNRFVLSITPRGAEEIVHFEANGAMTGYIHGLTNRGRWWVEPDGLLCRQYWTAVGGRKLCVYARIEHNRIALFSPRRKPRSRGWRFVEGPPQHYFTVDFSTSGERCESPRLSFSFAGVSDEAAAAFRIDACRALAKIDAWWGRTHTGPIRVAVSRMYSMGRSINLVWSGERDRTEFRARPVSVRQAPVVMQLMGLYAPNHNRFLAKGLAIYAQEVLGDHPAPPSYGRDLHETSRLILKTADGAPPLEQLDAIALPDRLKLPGSASSLSLDAAAGSFIRFLIEIYGMDKFRALYALTPLRPGEHGGSGSLARWQRIYGKPLAALEADWRAFLRAAPVKARN